MSVLAFVAAAIVGLALLIGSGYLCYRSAWPGTAACAVGAIGAIGYAAVTLDVPMPAVPFVIGCVGGWIFRKGKTFTLYLIVSSVVLTVLFGGFFYYLIWFRGVDVIGMVRSEMERMMIAAGAPVEVRSEFFAEFDASRNDIVYRVPFSAFLNGVILSAIGYAVLRKFFSKITDVTSVAGLERFRLNDNFIFALIGGLAVFLLIDKTAMPALHSAGLNVLLAATLLYFVQALGVIKFMMIKRNVPPFALPLLFVVLAVAGIGTMLFLFVMLAGIGALDVWADFRKLQDAGGRA